MILYSLVAVLAVGLSLPVDNHYENKGFLYTRQQILNRLCLVSVFLLLFLVSALRLNVGNDYAKYVEFMHLIRCDAVVPTEFGFNWVVKILYGISGFENYLLVFAVFAFATIYLFLKAIYQQADSFPFSFSCLWHWDIISRPLTRYGTIWHLRLPFLLFPMCSGRSGGSLFCSFCWGDDA